MAILSAKKHSMAKIIPARKVKILFFINSNILVLDLYTLYSVIIKNATFLSLRLKIRRSTQDYLWYSGKRLDFCYNVKTVTANLIENCIDRYGSIAKVDTNRKYLL